MIRKVSFYLNIVLLAILAAGAFQWMFISPRIATVARSVSPDGRLECLVSRVGPPPAKGIYFRYVLSIYEDGVPLPGTQLVVYLDSETFAPLTFKWSADHLQIFEEDLVTTSGRRAEVVFGRDQLWTFEDRKPKPKG